MQTRLPTHVWIDALVRRVQVAGASAFVVQKGDRERGDVVVKLATLDRMAALFRPAPLFSEEREFERSPGPYEFSPEFEIDEQINRLRSRDSDLWVVEIEDRKGRHFLTESVIGERAGNGNEQDSNLSE